MHVCKAGAKGFSLAPCHGTCVLTEAVHLFNCRICSAAECLARQRLIVDGTLRAATHPNLPVVAEEDKFMA